MSKSILVVDDDTLVRRSLTFSLEQAGYKVQAAANAEDGLAVARRTQPDLILMDIGLPGMDGLEALRQLKSQLNIPVIFVTGRRRELDEVLGLELGADDYITKPFDMDVLLARVRVTLRRAARPAQQEQADASVLTVGSLVINQAERTVTLAGGSIELPPRQFDLLWVLASDVGKVVSVDDILARVWGAEYAGEAQVVYVHIRWLREKLEQDPNQPVRIVTVRGIGYKLMI
jgi:DNA-binding response OmpR family regulator